MAIDLTPPPESSEWTPAEWRWFWKLCGVHTALEEYNQSWEDLANEGNEGEPITIDPYEAFVVLTMDRHGDAGTIPSLGATDEQLKKMLADSRKRCGQERLT